MRVHQQPIEARRIGSERRYWRGLVGEVFLLQEAQQSFYGEERRLARNCTRTSVTDGGSNLSPSGGRCCDGETSLGDVNKQCKAIERTLYLKPLNCLDVEL